MSLTGKPALTAQEPVENDGFWPLLQIGDLMEKYRIPAEYADQVIKTGLVLAMVRVNAKLKPVKDAMAVLGYSTLAAFIAANDAEQIDGVDVLVIEYENAVYARAKAGLLKQFQTINRRPQAENSAKESDETEQYWLDQSQGSIKVFFDLVLPDSGMLAKAKAYARLM